MRVIRFVDRLAKPRSFPIGVEMDAGVERVKFLLPQFSDSQVETLYWEMDERADADLLEDGVWSIDQTVTQAVGELACYITVSVSGEVLWHSDSFTARVVDLPQIEDRVAQLYPSAIQEAVEIGRQIVDGAEEAVENIEAAAEAASAQAAADMAAIEAKGAATIASIPSDYTALSATVDGLYPYNARDVLSGALTRVSETKNNVTFSWSGEVCTVSTTDAGASAITVNPMTGLVAIPMPDDILPGNRYDIKYSTTNAGVLLRVVFFAENGSTVVETKYITQDARMLIPEGAAKWALGLYIAKNTVITTPATVSDIRLISAKTNAELGESVVVLQNGMKSRFNGEKLSIIGDSIDTFNQAGYKIDGYNMYYPAHGVTDVNQTWWKRVMDASGMTIEVNASWSGSRVTDTYSDPSYPDFYDRVSVIGSPDVIFVTLGTNDSRNGVALGDYDFTTAYTSLSESTFRPAYIKGVKALKALYPDAEIVCITEKMEEQYRASVEYIARQLSVEYIDAGDYVGLGAADVHPGVLGMDQIAALVLYPTGGGLWQKHFPADAAETGRRLDAIGAYNCVDLLASGTKHIDGEMNGVSYSWNGDTCTVSTSGASTGASVNNFFVDSPLPQGVVPGEKYYVRYKTTDTAVSLSFALMKNGSDANPTYVYYTGNGILTIPDDVTFIRGRLFVASGTTLSTPAVVSEIALVNYEPYYETIYEGKDQFRYNPKVKSWYSIPAGTASFDAKTLEGNAYTRGTYGVLSATFTGMDAPEEITNLADSANIIVEKELLNDAGNLYVLTVTCTSPMLCWMAYRRYNSAAQDYEFVWGKDIGRRYYYVTYAFDANEIEDDAVARGQYQYLAGTFAGMNPPAEITNIPATSIVEIEKHAYNSPNNLYYLRIMCHFPVVDLKVMRYYHSPSSSYKYAWVAMERRHIYVSDTNANKFLVLRTDQGAWYFDETRQTNTNNYYHSYVLPVKKGDRVYLHTKVGSGQIKAYAKISVDYIKQEVYPADAASAATEFAGIIDFDYDGFLAFNVENANAALFECWIDSEKTQDVIRASQFANALYNPANTLPEYDDDNVCRVLVRGPSWMGAIHHWGIIGASFDSGEFNYTYPGAPFVSEIDWYEYSCWRYLQRINGIPDMYCYSDGGQNARDWIWLPNGIRPPARYKAYDSDEEEIATYGDVSKYGEYVRNMPFRSGIGHDGGCWWKMLEDYNNGNVKQAFVLNLGGNDINNENPHNSDWVEYDDPSQYERAEQYKCGTVEDIGTGELVLDPSTNKYKFVDHVPEGKTEGVVPGIVQSFAGYMGAIINRLIAIQPDCVIFLCTVHNMYSNNANRMAIWEQYNAVIREIAALPRYAGHIFLLDAAKYGPNFYSYPQYGFWVHYHPNALGYTYMAWTWNTMIDHVMQKNLGSFRQSMFIGTGKSYTPVT